MGLREEVILCLTDGEIHSGSAIARSLGVSRGAVWKHVQEMPALGLEVRAISGRGYKLGAPLELLDRDQIVRALDAESASTLEDLTIFSVTDSTSTRLVQAPGPGPGHFRAAVAEFQTDGRGRRGRRWISPYARGVCLSVSWSLENAPGQLQALALAVGVMVHRVLSAVGARDIALKWPNDLLFRGAKLGGILVDVAGESAGPLKVIVGLGLNIAPPGALPRGPDDGDHYVPAAGLDGALLDPSVSRNRIVGLLLAALDQGVRQFERRGFTAFIDEWRRHDFLLGKPISVHRGVERSGGIARGISPDGSLLVESEAGLVPLLSGDVSIRRVA